MAAVAVVRVTSSHGSNEMQHPTDDFEPCYSTAERPLTKPTQPGQFTADDLQAVPYDDHPVQLNFQDSEADDFLGISLYENTPLLIAEPHDKRGQEFERTQGLLKALGKDPSRVLRGNPESVPVLIEALKKMEDYSLRITVSAPSPTLAALMEAAPELLAQKTRRIVALGGFAQRDCEFGTNAGQKCYYTTHNLSANIPGAKTLFAFVKDHQVPCYVLSTENLKLGRHLNFDLPAKTRSMGDIPAARYLLEEMAACNEAILDGGSREKLQKLAATFGYEDLDVVKYNTTPADVILAVFNLAFDSLKIQSRRMEIDITEEPRFEKRSDGSWRTTKHRAATVTPSADSPIHYVDSFRLQGTNFDATRTVEVLSNHLLNRLWNTQLTRGNLMASSVSPSANAQTVFVAPAGTSAPAASVFVTASSSQPAPALVAPPSGLRKSIDVEELVKANPQMAWTLVSPATTEEILTMVANRDYFGLQALFKQTVVLEAQKNEYDYGLRCKFLEAFTELQVKIRQDGVPAGLTEAQKAEVNLFLTEGRGAESFRIFAKILFPLPVTAQDYPARAMQAALGKWHLRAYDVYPGEEGAQALGARIPGFAKGEMVIKGDLFFSERLELHEKCKAECATTMGQLSETLAKAQGDDEPSDTWIRGIIGAGKTTFLTEHLGIDQATQVVTSDTLKPLLGGPLTHHESARLNGELNDVRKGLRHSLNVRTNVFPRDAEDFTKVNKKKTMHDIHVTLATAKKRAQYRADHEGGRLPSDQELDQEGYQKAVASRPALIEHARTNPKVTYHLYDNNNDEQHFVPVLSIVNGKLQVHNLNLFDSMMQEPNFEAAIEPFTDGGAF